MTTELILQNLICEGCANTIIKRISQSEGISNLKMDVEKRAITVDFISHNALMGLYMDLATIGYPVEKNHD